MGRDTSLNDLRRIASEVVDAHAAEVDRLGKFPTESLAALREAGLLGAALPLKDGGRGWSIRELAWATEILAERCSSTGLIWAMQHSQVVTIAEHTGDSARWCEIRRAIAERGALIASVASEEAIGGNFGVSDAVLDQSTRPGNAAVVKKASAVSYGAQADAYLVSCRRGSDAPAHDTVVLFAWRDQCHLHDVGGWDGLGMRGTATTPMTIESNVPADQVFAPPFSEILRQTMIPVAHVLWSACWIGIASAAIRRASQCLGASRRPAISRLAALADASSQLDLARARHAQAIGEFARRPRASSDVAAGRPPTRADLAAAYRANELKILTSSLCASVVLGALSVIGMPGYVEDSQWTIARQLRDILAAPLMINNLRLRDVNAEIHALGERR